MNKTLIVLAALLVLLTACQTRVIMEQPGESHTLNVQGMSEFDVAPDLAKLRFRVETMSFTAQDAQNRNRQVAAQVMSALSGAGVREDEIETSDYRVERVQEWDGKLERMVDKGYRVSNAFVVSTKDLSKVGSLLDVAIQAGANSVESISFELSDERQREVKTQALKQAAQNAREKAVALADGSGVSLGKVRSVTENSYVVLPYARYDVMAMKAESAAAGMPPTPISPGDVRISAQVSLAYEVA